MAERLAPVDRELRGPRARLCVVAVHMQHGAFEALRAVGAVVAAEGVARIRGEADLVVDDHMDRAADGVAVEVHHVEALGHDALARERSVAVDEDRRDHLALCVAHQALLAAAAAHHDAVHELEVRRVRSEHHAELLPRRGRVLVRVAHVVLHIAAARRERGRPRLVELCEDLLQVLADDVREHIETPAVRHAERELTDAERGARLEHAVEERNQRLAAFEAEALLADIAVREEVLEAVRLEKLRQDALLGVGAELRAVARPLDALRDPRAALGRLDVHVLDAHRAAVGLLEARDDVGERRRVVERQRARVERLAEGFVVEADRLEGEVLGERTRRAERIELRREVAVGAVAVDQVVHPSLRERVGRR